ncbi:multidrug ABC transporter ATP-binding protein [Desulfoferula mesophila]|uniref:Multidrug ABC transporter ATP-binding protein n=1 Tax=Desulfoferula mesophila TaxID=3058419 RepID=A0AAU9EVX7_9BACT|nr:multidrug ABC transporter ATP-binding protein [Desulfoferula mesophilus]
MLRGLARRKALGLGVGFVALVLVDVFQLYIPRLIKFAVDDLTLGRADAQRLMTIGAGIVGLALAMVLMRLIWRPLLMGFSREVERRLRGELFEHLQSMHVGYLDDHPPGELMARATNDLNNIRMATGIGLVAAVDGAFMGLAAIGFMLYISPLLALLAILPMPAIVILTRQQSRRFHTRFSKVQEAFSAMTEQVREVISGVRLIKTYALADSEERRLEVSARGYLKQNLSLARVMALFFPLMVFFTNLSLAVVLGAGGPLAVFGQITPGDFVAFTAYLGMLTWPMMALGWVVSLLQRARASLERVSQVLEASPAVQDPARPARLPQKPELGVEVRELTYRYPGAASDTLSRVSLKAPAGQLTAVVGPIGSGKSTLLRLLGRLYEPPGGAVFVEGTDVLELAQEDLRSHVVQVPQEAFLFSATLAHNLALGDPSADEARLWAALEAAELAQEVRELPQGLETELGERAHTLSGGQRQRLCLARALLLDPAVLVLDDPLSAVDTGTETRILANLARLRAGRTTLVVSHRLGSVAFARHIYVLDQGLLVEEGDHASLMALQGLYHDLFAEQAILAELEEG